jgi:hypothetical protein
LAQRFDDELTEFLDRSGVNWARLDEHAHWAAEAT